MRYSSFGQTIENVFYFERGVDYDADSCADLALAIKDSYDTNFRPIHPTELTLIDITVTAQHVESGPNSNLPVGEAGTSGSAGFETTGNTFVIKFGTGSSGRSFRGRMYWPHLVNSWVSNNQIDNTTALSLATAAESFFDDIETATGDRHAIVSYQHDCEWRTLATVTDVVNYTYTDLNLDSQRRRLSGRGI
jgi:hypothetical protein